MNSIIKFKKVVIKKSKDAGDYILDENLCELYKDTWYGIYAKICRGERPSESDISKATWYDDPEKSGELYEGLQFFLGLVKFCFPSKCQICRHINNAVCDPLDGVGVNYNDSEINLIDDYNKPNNQPDFDFNHLGIGINRVRSSDDQLSYPYGLKIDGKYSPWFIKFGKDSFAKASSGATLKDEIGESVSNALNDDSEKDSQEDFLTNLGQATFNALTKIDVQGDEDVLKTLRCEVDMDILGIDTSIAINLFRVATKELKPRQAFIRELVRDGYNDDESGEFSDELLEVCIQYTSGVTGDTYNMSMTFNSSMLFISSSNVVIDSCF